MIGPTGGVPSETRSVCAGYWMHETSGVLRPAVEAYLAGGELSAEHVAALRAYLRQWIGAPAWRGFVVDELRRTLDGLAETAKRFAAVTTRQAITAWLDLADEAGIDPL